MTHHASDVLISEVGPRDGLQNASETMPTAAKCRWIEALAASGLREIEVGSFVPAKILPQLADTAEIVAFARTLPDLDVAVLVPNLRGAENALAAGVHKMTVPLSVSETHSLKNVRRTHEQMFEEIRAIRAAINARPEQERPELEGSLSTVFGCTLEGTIPDDKILRIAETLMDCGCDEVGLSDTTGFADPASVQRLVRKVRGVVGDEHLTGIHLHKSRGLGLANALAAFESGLTTFDASMGGLGGCPFAPGASGNIVTEDLVFMFEAMGVSTGIDLDALMAARELLREGLPNEPIYGFTPDAGLPKGFRETGLAAH